MSPIDVIILGTVLEQPQSAYAIQKDAETHHYAEWTKVSTPSIYRRVLTLCKEGYLDGTRMPGDMRGEKIVYSITEKGKAHFVTLMKAYASAPTLLQFDFNVVITNLNRMDKQQQTALLARLRENFRRQLAIVRDKKAEHADLPARALAIFHQQELLLEALLAWLTDFQNQPDTSKKE